MTYGNLNNSYSFQIKTLQPGKSTVPSTVGKELKIIFNKEQNISYCQLVSFYLTVIKIFDYIAERASSPF